MFRSILAFILIFSGFFALCVVDYRIALGVFLILCALAMYIQKDKKGAKIYKWKYIRRKKMIKVEMVSYDELPEEVRGLYLSNNGTGRRYATYLLVYHNDKLIRYESDAIEPEDAQFCRDLSWVEDAIVEAYNIGVNENAW